MTTPNAFLLQATCYTPDIYVHAAAKRARAKWKDNIIAGGSPSLVVRISETQEDFTLAQPQRRILSRKPLTRSLCEPLIEVPLMLFEFVCARATCINSHHGDVVHRIATHTHTKNYIKPTRMNALVSVKLFLFFFCWMHTQCII